MTTDPQPAMTPEDRLDRYNRLLVLHREAMDRHFDAALGVGSLKEARIADDAFRTALYENHEQETK